MSCRRFECVFGLYNDLQLPTRGKKCFILFRKVCCELPLRRDWLAWQEIPTKILISDARVSRRLLRLHYHAPVYHPLYFGLLCFTFRSIMRPTWEDRSVTADHSQSKHLLKRTLANCIDSCTPVPRLGRIKRYCPSAGNRKSLWPNMYAYFYGMFPRHPVEVEYAAHLRKS